MKTDNSLSVNGVSVCQSGQENYTIFHPVHIPEQSYFQYDYRHTDGNLFSCVDSSLESCRNRRDKWLRSLNEAKKREEIRQNGKTVLHSSDGVSIKTVFNNLTGRNFDDKEIYRGYINSVAIPGNFSFVEIEYVRDGKVIETGEIKR